MSEFELAEMTPEQLLAFELKQVRHDLEHVTGERTAAEQEMKRLKAQLKERQKDYSKTLKEAVAEVERLTSELAEAKRDLAKANHLLVRGHDGCEAEQIGMHERHEWASLERKLAEVRPLVDAAKALHEAMSASPYLGAPAELADLIAAVDAFDESDDGELSELEIVHLAASDLAGIAAVGGIKSVNVDLPLDDEDAELDPVREEAEAVRLDAQLADVNRRWAADKRVLDAAKTWRRAVRAWGGSLAKMPGSIVGAQELVDAVDALVEVEDTPQPQDQAGGSEIATVKYLAGHYPHARCGVKPRHMVHVWGEPKHYCDGGFFDESAPSNSQPWEHELTAAFAGARVRFWTCPAGHSGGPLMPLSAIRQTVEWRDGIAHCLEPGCGKTSGPTSEQTEQTEHVAVDRDGEVER